MFIDKLSVLIVDDLIDTQELLAVYAKMNGFQAYTAFDGVEALDLMENESIDIVISDLFMPKLSGLSFLREVRKRGWKTPFVFATAYADKDSTIQAFSNGAYDYMLKPVKAEDFAKMLGQVSSYVRTMEKLGPQGAVKQLKNASKFTNVVHEMHAIKNSFSNESKEKVLTTATNENQWPELRIAASDLLNSNHKSFEWLLRGKNFNWDLSHLLRVSQSIERLCLQEGLLEAAKLANGMSEAVALLRSENHLINEARVEALRAANDCLLEFFGQDQALIPSRTREITDRLKA
ncbi:MAG: response regulator [Oligoflexus sp.]|nr:response regulator [Oligoflexus sp.]